MLSWGKAAACSISHRGVQRFSTADGQAVWRWLDIHSQNDSGLPVQAGYVPVYLHFFFITGRIFCTRSSAINPKFSYCLSSCLRCQFNLSPADNCLYQWGEKEITPLLHKSSRSQGTNSLFHSSVMWSPGCLGDTTCFGDWDIRSHLFQGSAAIKCGGSLFPLCFLEGIIWRKMQKKKQVSWM